MHLQTFVILGNLNGQIYSIDYKQVILLYKRGFFLLYVYEEKEKVYSKNTSKK